MDVALIYELSNPDINSRFVEELKPLGYRTSWRAGADVAAKSYTLPQFMLWKQNAEFKAVIAEINSIKDKINLATPGTNLVINHCITLDTARWDGIPDTV